MAEPVKFTFEQSFDGGARTKYDREVAALRAEIDAARAAAHAEGVDAGRTQAFGEIEAATRQVLAELSANVNGLLQRHAAIEAELQKQMAALAQLIAARLVPALISRYPTAELEALIAECLQTVRKEPRIVVRVSESLAEAVDARLEAIKSSLAYAGELVLIAEPAMGALDCHVEWHDGGVERSETEIQSEIDAAVERFVMLLDERNNEVGGEGAGL
ncbi:FliH/SctL family protein [Gimibacter soli]|uniref:FliH/SctL family protein n=1 Tax=Gimibacter soli TaxID=3024400 RepID=A0AAE9XU67_9PROT|nr:FliH/SctL family protein [Gimibacter soli]WCL55390.1 FliH/SctL family protein [Gimibacter soli]